jgi:hypothetical protein
MRIMIEHRETTWRISVTEIARTCGDGNVIKEDMIMSNNALHDDVLNSFA